MFFGSVEKPPRLSEFELNVPERLVAKDPLKKRDECKLMVLNRKENTIEHRKFKDMIDYFNKGDVMVMNNTRVIQPGYMQIKTNLKQEWKCFYCEN